jgi:hypothetical protein
VAWTKITRRKYDRSALRYASDSTDAEWVLIAPFLGATHKVGCPLEGVMYFGGARV